MQPADQPAGWNEQDSAIFIDLGRYMVPEREVQIELICDLIPAGDRPFEVVELCCGEGLLAGALLARFPGCTVRGFDGSAAMLQRAQERLADYGERFRPQQFDLAAHEWRDSVRSARAVVSSLAIHHLDAAQKQRLYHDAYAMLEDGGVLVIADLVQPTDLRGQAVAANAWNVAVRRRSLELAGNTAAFDFFQRERWNLYIYPDPVDMPSPLFDQLKWLEQAGFGAVDVYWMQAGHAIFGGRKLNSELLTLNSQLR